MSYHGDIRPATASRPAPAQACLLLPQAVEVAPDRLAATFLAALGAAGGTLSAVRRLPRRAPNRRRAALAGGLALRSSHLSGAIALLPGPLGAEHFNRTLPPFITPARRAEMMGVITHHQACIFLHLRPRPGPFALPAPVLLHRATAAIGREVGASGLIWGPNRRLHLGRQLGLIFESPAPVALLLAPRLASIGPRRLPAIHFAGARQVLGLSLHMHLPDMDFHAAANVGFAFARAVLDRPALRHRQSFDHNGQSYRLSHSGDGKAVVLIPAARKHPQPGPLQGSAA